MSPSETLEDLQQKVSELWDWKAYWTLSFVHENVALESKRMQDLGIQEGSVLTVLKRETWILKDCGASSYNQDYFCRVLELREVGPCALELHFRATGDGSLGPLQKAESSFLFWKSEGQEATSGTRRLDEDLFFFLHHGLAPSGFQRAHPKVSLEVDTEALKEGSMIFEEVPTVGSVAFVYGEGGYGKLDIEIGAK